MAFPFYFVYQVLHSGFMLLGLHEVKGLLKLVQQFGIGAAHAVGKFHAESLHAGRLVGHVHVQQAEVEEAGVDFLFEDRLFLYKAKCESAEWCVGSSHGQIDKLVVRQGKDLGNRFVGQDPGRIARCSDVSIRKIWQEERTRHLLGKCADICNTLDVVQLLRKIVVCHTEKSELNSDCKDT